MVSEKLIEIVRRLVKLTQEGKLNWTEGLNSDTFLLAFRTYTLSISSQSGVSDPLEPIIVINIFNAEGEVIESVSDEDFPGDVFAREARTPYKMLYELYQNARRKAVGIDVALDTILSDLPEPDFPF